MEDLPELGNVRFVVMDAGAFAGHQPGDVIDVAQIRRWVGNDLRLQPTTPQPTDCRTGKDCVSE